MPVPTAVPGVDPIRGGTLTAVQQLNARGLDPFLRISTGIVTPIRPMYDKLIEPSKFDGASAVPDLATEWSLSSDGKVYSFKLREGVTFHDGSAFTAEDVVYSMDRMKNAEKYESQTEGDGGAPSRLRDPGNAAAMAVVDAAVAIDDTTVEIRLKEFSSAFFNQLLELTRTLYILPSDVRPGDVNEKGNGTGPFRFVSSEADVKFVMEASPDHWKTDAAGRQIPYLDAIEIFIISDTTAIIGAFTSGNVLWQRPVVTNRLAGRNAELTSSIPGWQHANMASTLNSLFLNNRNPALRDPRVREAIDIAVDRFAVRDLAYGPETAIVLHGVGIPAELNGAWALPRQMFEGRPGYADNQVDRARDVLAARQLMRAAGFSPDNPLELRFVARLSSQEAMQIAIDSLADIWVVPTGEGLVIPGSSDFDELRTKNWDVGWFFLFSGSPFPGANMRLQYGPTFNDEGYFTEHWDLGPVGQLWVDFLQARTFDEQLAIAEEIQIDLLERRIFVPLFRTKRFHSWWPSLRNMPLTQCCTVADVVEDMEQLWIDRDFTPFGDKTDGGSPNYVPGSN